MERRVRLRRSERAALAARAWFWFVFVRLSLKRRPLSDFVARLGRPSRIRSRGVDPVRLGKLVARSLRIGELDPRCMFTALVLFRLLREQGERAELVIGLPRHPTSKDAHAWVELDGVDVGPPPGRSQHEELVRYR
jgi:hypothetical protein